MPELQWQKSSFSSPDGHNGECLEIAADRHRTHLRESDEPSTVLSITRSALRAFLSAAPTLRGTRRGTALR